MFPTSVPRVPFLARLSPGARERTGGVRAALPSRFDAGRASDETLAEQVVEIPAERPAVPPEEAPPTHAPRRDAPVTTVAAAAGTPEVASFTVTPRPELPPLRTVALAVPPAPGAERSAGDATVADPSEPPARTARPAVSPGPAAPDAGRGQSRAAVLRTVSEPLPERSRPALGARQPLREAALAQRDALPRSATQDVVQVTIERIDVRMPSDPAPDRRASSKPRAPSVPLGEYLRERGKSRRGGAGS
jgi:hypothetical protein